MSLLAISLLGAAAAMIFGLLITLPLELRENRWRSIAFSMPFSILIANLFLNPLTIVGGVYGLLSVFFFALVWRSALSHYCASGVCRMIYGNANLRTGVHADFRGARSFKEQGDLDEAVRLAELELIKEPNHYQGLHLLAQLHGERGDLAETAATLERILRVNTLTREQRQFVKREWDYVEEQRLVRELNRKAA